MPISDSAAPNPTASSAQPYVFFLGPFRFESEIDIPELRATSGSGEITVPIRLGGVPTAIEAALFSESDCQISLTECLINIPGTARYLVRNGSEVRLEIVPGVPMANVCTYLLGSVFGVLCHQNGMLPLHASAIESGGLVTAFLGDSGAGKSTLVACLQRRGHRIVSDDICVLQPTADPNAAMRVVPVASWLKLWKQSLQYLGEAPVEKNRVFSTDDKFRFYLTNTLPESSSQRPRLARVVFLAKAPESHPHPALQPLPLLEAITGLMAMTYIGFLPSLVGQQSNLFQQCARVFQHSQALRLTVPWGLDNMDAVLDLIEKDLLENDLK